MKTTTLIFQNKATGEIVDFYCERGESIHDRLKSLSLERVYVDCDEDSYLYSIDEAIRPGLNWLELFPEKAETFSHIQKLMDWFSQNPNQMLPIVTVDASGQLLMQAYGNALAVETTLNEGLGVYFSRSRNKLWKKGEESGHLQIVQSVSYCPENKFLLYRVQQTGSACHTGNYTCFYRPISQLKLSS